MPSFLADKDWPRGRGSVLLQVALCTFGILVLELALIRWISGQIRILAYFNNLILIGCFLGMGLGLVLGPRRPGLVHLVAPGLALLCVPLAFSPALHLVHLVFPDPSVSLWGAEAGGASWLQAGRVYAVILGIFSAVVAVFALAAAPLGHLLSERGGLPGYSADLLGSLLGVLAMAAVTALGTSPPVWMALGIAPFLWLSRRPLSIVSGIAAVALAYVSINGAVFSPYNRIDVVSEGEMTTLEVNRDFHQYMHDLRGPLDAGRLQVRQMYDVPFLLTEAKQRALIVGAGTGNDVEGALRNGFGQIYSVDIDGRIIAIGKAMHPEHPYSDPRTVPVVNDARAFFETYRGEPFDVVCFGLVDSHAMFSALSTLRLDNYLYTEQGLRSAWRHVGPGGVMTVNLSFAAGNWMLQRLYWTMAAATGQPPLVVTHGLHSAAMLVAQRDPARVHWERVPFPVVRYAKRVPGTLTTSDDWPFLYLRPRTVPWGYILVLGGILALAVVSTVAVNGRAAMREGFDWALFLMGAAFLLLETRGITSLSLLFGSTWVVNTVVFSGVLGMALLANTAVVRWRPQSPLPAFVALVAALVLLWAVDVSSLNRLPLILRAVAGGALVGLPVGCAGVAVSVLLARARSLPGALAANLLGAVVGGCLEYLSMYVGLRALALMALGLYLGALLIEVRRGPVRVAR